MALTLPLDMGRNDRRSMVEGGLVISVTTPCISTMELFSL